VAPHKWFCACGEPTTNYLARQAEAGPRAADDPASGAEPDAVVQRAPVVVPATVGATHSRLSILRFPMAIVVALAVVIGAGKGIAYFHEQRDADVRAKLETYLHTQDVAPFTATDLGFRATFPTEPSRDVREPGGAESLPVSFYRSQVGQHAFIVSVIDLEPTEGFDLRAAPRAAADEVDGTVVETKETTFAGVEALEVRVKASDGMHQAIFFRRTTHAYALEVVGPEAHPLGYERFKGSFAVL
jgi:hypothetical protein